MLFKSFFQRHLQQKAATGGFSRSRIATTYRLMNDTQKLCRGTEGPVLLSAQEGVSRQGPFRGELIIFSGLPHHLLLPETGDFAIVCK
jgi:hypothetical protein